MIIADYPYGRLGNLFQLASHLIIFSRMTGTPVSLAFLRESAPDLPFFDGDHWLRYPRARGDGLADRAALLALKLAKRLRLVPTVDYLRENAWVFFDERDHDSDPDLSLLRHARFVFFKGWRFRARKAPADARRVMQEVFRPRQAILDRAQAIRARVDADVVVGVHIRWGDLKASGLEHYFPVTVYRRIMEDVVALHPGKRVGFLVCAEEPHIPGLEDLNPVMSSGSPIEDLYTLAACDHIISNGSTFARWASYWGEKGMYTIASDDARATSLADFPVYDWDFSNV
jgi:hypothetical protein